MPSDMGSRKLGSGRYRGLDEESHMPGFQNPMGQPVDPILWSHRFSECQIVSITYLKKDPPRREYNLTPSIPAISHQKNLHRWMFIKPFM